MKSEIDEKFTMGDARIHLGAKDASEDDWSAFIVCPKCSEKMDGFRGMITQLLNFYFCQKCKYQIDVPASECPTCNKNDKWLVSYAEEGKGILTCGNCRVTIKFEEWASLHNLNVEKLDHASGYFALSA